MVAELVLPLVTTNWAPPPVVSVQPMCTTLPEVATAVTAAGVVSGHVVAQA
jgi:hypothetical protein